MAEASRFGRGTGSQRGLVFSGALTHDRALVRGLSCDYVRLSKKSRAYKDSIRGAWGYLPVPSLSAADP